MVDPNKLKTCSQCGVAKPLSEFHRRQHFVRSGFRAACKACTAEIAKQDRLEYQRKSDPLKERVRARTKIAIKNKTLTSLPCSICGSLDVQAHHEDYDSPDAHIKVTWLCVRHHAMEHGIRPWTKQIELFPVEG